MFGFVLGNEVLQQILAVRGVDEKFTRRGTGGAITGNEQRRNKNSNY